MEERFEQKFLGKTLFTWTGWDEAETGMLQFYDVEFPFESMKKFNGSDVSLQLDGTMEIYSTDYDNPDNTENFTVYKTVWTGYPTDIKEWNE